eukprot:8385295-Heterocapsa_arctica.AAC.1
MDVARATLVVPFSATDVGVLEPAGTRHPVLFSGCSGRRGHLVRLPCGQSALPLGPADAVGVQV